MFYLTNNIWAWRTWHCLRHKSRFLRCALEKWSQAFCLVAAPNTFSICSTFNKRNTGYSRAKSSVVSCWLLWLPLLQLLHYHGSWPWLLVVPLLPSQLAASERYWAVTMETWRLLGVAMDADPWQHMWPGNWCHGNWVVTIATVWLTHKILTETLKCTTSIYECWKEATSVTIPYMSTNTPTVYNTGRIVKVGGGLGLFVENWNSLDFNFRLFFKRGMGWASTWAWVIWGKVW